MFHEWKPYVPVAVRRKQAKKRLDKLAKKGQPISPVVIEGRVIATTFWGKSWCQNLERYSDYASRLPRGRTYVRNGSVVDLQIDKGAIAAWVSGSELYKVAVKIATVPTARWNSPFASGETRSDITFVPPADSPKIVTRSGSPPNAAAFSRTHASARTRSSVP